MWENLKLKKIKQEFVKLAICQFVYLNHFSFSYRFETSDGTSRQEQGEYKNDTEQQGLVVKGNYKYVAPDGQHISVSFVADKNGYQPTENKDDSATTAAAQN